jgi:transposase
MTDFAAVLGIDWSDQKHDLCLIPADSGRKEFSVLEHSPEAIADFAAQLRTRFCGQPVAVCLEQSRGPLLFALLKYDFLVLYPVHPKTLAKYREAFSPSRAKDDPRDAEYAAELVLHHRDRLTAWLPDDEKTRTLRFLVEARRRLVSDRTRISNRMTALLKAYFPQILAWFPDIRTPIVCDFLDRWPSLDALARVRPSTLERFFAEHTCRRRDTVARRIEAIGQAVPLTTDRAVIDSSVIVVGALVAQMRVVIDAVAELDRRIAALYQQHPDAELFSALPGAGAVYASRLLAVIGARRDRFASADELARFSGVAPVTERSGTYVLVRWRYFCPKFVRQSFVEYAGESIRHSFWAGAYYARQRERGKSHQAAVRALAFKWIRIIWKCWQTRTPYDEVVYLESLRKKRSPLLAFAATSPH